MKITARDYIRDCSSLLADLEDFSSDYELSRLGWTINYAIDFSELHAYVLPEQSAQGVKAFVDDDAQVAHALQLRASQRIFRSAERKPILLSPYVVELEAFVRSQAKRDFIALGDAIANAVAEYRRLRETGDLPWVESLARRVHEGGPITATEEERAQRFLEQHAVALVGILGDNSATPRKRLRALLSEGAFQDLESLVGDEFTPDLRFAEEVQRQLDVARPRAPTEHHAEKSSNHLDAFAIALIRDANRKLEPKKIRLRLVSRSVHMRRVCAQLAVEWEGSGGNPVRHPRFFSAFHATVGNRGDDALAQLEVMRKSLEVFLQSYSSAEHNGSLETFAAMQGKIAELKHLWRTSLGLASTLQTSAEVAPSGEIRMLSALVRTEGGLRHRLERRVVELADEMQRDYQALGLLVGAEVNPERRGLLEEHIKSWEREDGALLGSSLHYMPYVLEFHSADIQAALTRSDTPFSGIAELRGGLDSERLLAMAYFFGSWGEWAMAERYCDLALEERDFAARFSGNEDPAPGGIYEAYYFKAVCIKEQARSPERLNEALKLLERAEAAKCNDSQLPDDPRYLKEKAAIAFLWHDMVHRQPEFATSQYKMPSEGEAVDWSTQALATVQNSTERSARLLQAQIHNNLCYYFGGKRTAQARSLANAHLERLEHVQRCISSKDIKKWPPNVLDTVAWTRWNLADGNVTQRDIDTIERLFQLALSNIKLLPEERSQIAGHLSYVQARAAHS